MLNALLRFRGIRASLGGLSIMLEYRQKDNFPRCMLTWAVKTKGWFTLFIMYYDVYHITSEPAFPLNFKISEEID